MQEEAKGALLKMLQQYADVLTRLILATLNPH